MNQFLSLGLPLALPLVLAASAVAQCSAPLYGPGCGGNLAITFTPEGGAGNQRIDIQGSNLQPNTIGLMVWGYIPAFVPLGGGCNLLVDFAWGHLIQTDAAGQWGWSRVWPHSSMPGAFYIQLGSLLVDAGGNLVVVASDARRAECL